MCFASDAVEITASSSSLQPSVLAFSSLCHILFPGYIVPSCYFNQSLLDVGVFVWFCLCGDLFFFCQGVWFGFSFGCLVWFGFFVLVVLGGWDFFCVFLFPFNLLSLPY